MIYILSKILHYTLLYLYTQFEQFQLHLYYRFSHTISYSGPIHRHLTLYVFLIIKKYPISNKTHRIDKKN